LAGPVVVVGSYNQDFVWTSDALPVPGATRLGTFASGPGGKGFNQAIAAARVGAATVFITALGEDAAADTARALAAADGLELRAQVQPDLPSGTAGIFVDGDGRNVIVVAPGANDALSVDFIARQADAFAPAGVVLAQLEVHADAVLAALQAGRAAGALTVLNPAPANAPTTAALLAAADVLTPNETEFVAMLSRHAGVDVPAETLAGRPPEQLHALCRQLAPGALVVITLGASGIFVSHRDGDTRGDGEAFYAMSPAPVRPVDTTGAGDAFNGALAARLAQAPPEAPFRAAAAFANVYAGWSTELPGAAASMRRVASPGDAG
jgi:ribokinase